MRCVMFIMLFALIGAVTGCGRDGDSIEGSICGERPGKTCNSPYDIFPDECLPDCEESEFGF